MAAFVPTAKTFAQRLDAFLAAAQNDYQVTIKKQATLRNPADAQKWHIAHMFYYNSFASRKPVHHEMENGHAVIEWAWIQHADLVWGFNVDWRLFLKGGYRIRSPLRRCRKSRLTRF
jgi:hypothetical protein